MNLQDILESIFQEVFEMKQDEIFEAELYQSEAWDSFAHMQLMMLIEERIGFKGVTPDDFSNLTSFKKIYEYLVNANT